MSNIPENWTLWKHKSGVNYVVILVSNTSADEDRKSEYPATVVYRRVSDNTYWSRPLSKWHESFTEIK